STRGVDLPRTSARGSVPNSARSLRAIAPVATARRKYSRGALHDGGWRRLGCPWAPEALPAEGRIVGRAPREGETSPRRRRDRFLDRAERNPRDRRRVGLREDDDRSPPGEVGGAHRGPAPLPRKRHREPEGSAPEGLQTASSIVL